MCLLVKKRKKTYSYADNDIKDKIDEKNMPRNGNEQIKTISKQGQQQNKSTETFHNSKSYTSSKLKENRKSAA